MVKSDEFRKYTIFGGKIMNLCISLFRVFRSFMYCDKQWDSQVSTQFSVSKQSKFLTSVKKKNPRRMHAIYI